MKDSLSGSLVRCAGVLITSPLNSKKEKGDEKRFDISLVRCQAEATRKQD